MITITGGTYRERCLCPDFDFKFGSGLRACHAIHALDDSVEVEFHTFCSPDNDLFLTMGRIQYFVTNISKKVTKLGQTFTF